MTDREIVKECIAEYWSRVTGNNYTTDIVSDFCMRGESIMPVLNSICERVRAAVTAEFADKVPKEGTLPWGWMKRLAGERVRHDNGEELKQLAADEFVASGWSVVPPEPKPLEGTLFDHPYAQKLYCEGRWMRPEKGTTWVHLWRRPLRSPLDSGEWIVLERGQEPPQ